ncbi:hypothetical protein BHQ21_15195 [Mycobacterium sherrisii]|uniref:Uncharacterized protein n=1 Tax=Mycobacterium sherrisii TaxID=243061 RepID=A0A1E3SSL2_9MYCO|nr:hypothetical protein BHQ21_15195 [Mycobacterium sherrisii]
MIERYLPRANRVWKARALLQIALGVITQIRQEPWALHYHVLPTFQPFRKVGTVGGYARDFVGEPLRHASVYHCTAARWQANAQGGQSWS